MLSSLILKKNNNINLFLVKMIDMGKNKQI